MKSRLCHLSLLPMCSSVDRNHALSEEQLRATLGALLNKVGVLHDEDFPDVLWVVDEDDVTATNFVMGYVPELGRQVLEVVDGINKPPPAQNVPRQIVRHPRWKPVTTLAGIR
jgi:hypothetical protein